ncbi:MAG: SNF2-related protein [Myxococcales bacterium]|jgi:superfamily II DNA or RNA helicase
MADTQAQPATDPVSPEVPEPLLAFALSSGLVGAAQKVLDQVLQRHPEVAFDLLLAEARGESPRLPCVWPNAAVRSAVLGAAIRHFESTKGLTVVPLPPTAKDAVRRWASAQGIRPFLSQPATRALKRWTDYRDEREINAWSLADILDFKDPDDPLARLTRTYLWAQAQVVRRAGASAAPASAEEAPRPARPEPEPAAPRPNPARAHPLQKHADLVAAALERRARVCEPKRQGERRPRKFEMRLTPEGDVLIDWNQSWYPTWTTVAIEQGRIGEATCDCAPARRTDCRHIAWSCEAIAELLRSGLHDCSPEMVEILGTPAWKRRLLRLDNALARLHSVQRSGELLSFRLSVSYSRIALEPYVHQPLKHGGHSPGRRETITAALKQRFPECERALIALEAGVSNNNVARALEALQGFPRLYFDIDPSQPIRVRTGALTFELRGDAAMGGFRLVPTVDGDEKLGRALVECHPQGRDRVLADVANNACILVHVSGGQEALLLALGNGCDFPAESLGELVPRLELLERHAPLALPTEFEGELVPAAPRLVARLTPGDKLAVRLELRVRPLGEGLAVEPGAGPDTISAFRDGRRVRAERDREAELARARALLDSLGLPPQAEAAPWTYDLVGEAALDLVAALEAQAGSGLVIEWPHKRLTTSRGLGPKSLQMRVEDRRDWFGLSGELQLDGAKVSLALLLEAVRQGRRWVEVGPGQFAEIAGELRARLQQAADVVYAGRSGLEVSPAAASALDDLLDAAGELQVCAAWRALVERMKSARATEPVLPAGLRAELRAYQLEGFRWLARMAQWGVGACLADDMGLGKTVQALAALLGRAELGPAMVVAPTSVCFNWVREAERFAPGLRPILFREGDRAATLATLGPGDLLVCSYGLLVQHAEELKACRLATLVLDEAQAVKNPATRRARAARDLQADWKLALTGTPLENHIGELWSLFRILNPGLLGSWDQFRERFAGPIERLKDPARREGLARVVRPFILRRTKAEVARDLPARTEMRRLVSLSTAERQLYDEARMVALASLASEAAAQAGADKRFAVLAALTRLRQLACHPRLHDAASKVGSSKLRALLELVDELRANGHRALVFSQFTSHLALVREALDTRKVSYLYLDGQTPEAERMRRVDRFQRGEADLFLISLKAGGTGLNLTAADFVIHLDPWWNPAVEDQATDRAHRIGQTRPVTLYRLVAKGTIEEAILEMHEKKRDLVAGVLEGASGSAKLSTEELLELIRAGEGEVGSEPDELGDEAEPAAAGATSRSPLAPVVGLVAREDEPLSELFERFAAHLSDEVSAGTANTYCIALRKLPAWIEESEKRSCDQIKAAELLALIQRFCEANTASLARPRGRVMRTVLNRLVRFAAPID